MMGRVEMGRVEKGIDNKRGICVRLNGQSRSQNGLSKPTYFWFESTTGYACDPHGLWLALFPIPNHVCAGERAKTGTATSHTRHGHGWIQQLSTTVSIKVRLHSTLYDALFHLCPHGVLLPTVDKPSCSPCDHSLFLR